MKAPSFKHFQSSSKTASRTLSKIKSTDTKAECLLRSALWKLGLRFRKHVLHLPGKPDIVFSRQHVAIFCDGDFWHGRKWPKSKRRLQGGSNAIYWLSKISANIERDKRCNRQLKKLGWIVMRMWESDILEDPDLAATKVAEIIHSLRQV